MLLLLLHSRQGHRFGAGCKYFIGRQDQGWKRETPGSLCRDGGMMEEREGIKGCGMQERKRGDLVVINPIPLSNFPLASRQLEERHALRVWRFSKPVCVCVCECVYVCVSVCVCECVVRM